MVYQNQIKMQHKRLYRCVKQEKKNFYAPLKELLINLNTSSPHIPVTCIIADGLSGFAGRVAKDLGIQELQF